MQRAGGEWEAWSKLSGCPGLAVPSHSCRLGHTISRCAQTQHWSVMQPPSHSHSASGECGHAMRHWRSWQSRGGGASRAAGAAGTAAGRLEQPEVMAHTWVQHKGHGRIEVAAQLGNETHSAAWLGSTGEQCAQPCSAVHLVPGTAAATSTRQAQCQAGATAQQHPLNCTAPNVAPVVLQHMQQHMHSAA